MNAPLMEQANAKLNEAIAKEDKFADTLANGPEKQVALVKRTVDKLLEEAVQLEAKAIATPAAEPALAA